MVLTGLLKAPYPHSQEPKSNFRSSLGIGLVVAIVLFFVQVGGMPILSALQMAFEFGLVTATISLLISLVTSGLKSSWFHEQKWTVGKEILYVMLHLAVIALANMIYTKLRYPGAVHGFPYLEWVGNTCLIGLAPVTVSVLVNQYRLFKRNNAQANELTQQLHTNHEAPTPLQNAIIQIKGDNQGEIHELNINDFLYAESADNYVVVHYLRQSTQDTQSTNSIAPSANFIFRSTLKRIALQLEGHSQVIQCHRSYLVNTMHITDVSGNAAGLRLTMAHCATEIPVSRNLIQQVRSFSKS